MQLGASIINLAPGKTSRSVQQDLTVKCEDDVEFEIHDSGSGSGGGNLVQLITNVNIEDKVATLTLSNN